MLSRQHLVCFHFSPMGLSIIFIPRQKWHCTSRMWYSFFPRSETKMALLWQFWETTSAPCHDIRNSCFAFRWRPRSQQCLSSTFLPVVNVQTQNYWLEVLVSDRSVAVAFLLARWRCGRVSFDISFWRFFCLRREPVTFETKPIFLAFRLWFTHLHYR
jgi:hypothetical protein